MSSTLANNSLRIFVLVTLSFAYSNVARANYGVYATASHMTINNSKANQVNPMQPVGNGAVGLGLVFGSDVKLDAFSVAGSLVLPTGSVLTPQIANNYYTVTDSSQTYSATFSYSIDDSGNYSWGLDTVTNTGVTYVSSDNESDVDGFKYYQFTGTGTCNLSTLLNSSWTSGNVDNGIGAGDTLNICVIGAVGDSYSNIAKQTATNAAYQIVFQCFDNYPDPETCSKSITSISLSR